MRSCAPPKSAVRGRSCKPIWRRSHYDPRRAPKPRRIDTGTVVEQEPRDRGGLPVLLQRYAAERFLYCLGKSLARDGNVLEDGALLAIWIKEPTALLVVSAMKRETKCLLVKATDSLVLSIEHFNRPWDRGRVDAVLILLDHAFEMLLKAAILHRGGTSGSPGKIRQSASTNVCEKH